MQVVVRGNFVRQTSLCALVLGVDEVFRGSHMQSSCARITQAIVPSYSSSSLYARVGREHCILQMQTFVFPSYSSSNMFQKSLFC